ncbi:response regulator transcription factor [Natronoglycomyces albus]|uniref:Response regulator transcription factor n=2 Tax=Natronoglycomyces albus TaxID=2811108 RepID=A0A895XUN8_9ACTN|nr:response regulator transcription factor [Natronoglycomyces albus]
MGLAQAVRAVANTHDVYEELRRRPIDVVLVDVNLATPDPVHFTREVRQRSRGTAVVMAGPTDPRTAAMVVAAGARGVIRSASADNDDLLVALTQAIMLVCPQVAAQGLPRQRAAMASRSNLTTREMQVLRGMSEGKSNAEIGRDLFVSEDTVKTHARRMFRKLGARDRAHAVAEAFRAGIVH